MEIQESQESQESSKTEKPPPHLPAEIVLQIVAVIHHAEDSQSTLWACTLVSRLWYCAAVQALYDTPCITGRNFLSFAGTICPSKKSHGKKNELSNVVKTLDMSMLVHNSSNSLTAKLLGRCKKKLEVFIAPQATFGVTSLTALSKCCNLTCLDLSSLSVPLFLPAFFNAISKLDKLNCLYFPRSSDFSNFSATYPAGPPSWPMNLVELHIGGSIKVTSLPYFIKVPPSLVHLGIQAYSNLSTGFIRAFLQRLNGQLQTLSILEHMIELSMDSLDGILLEIPSLRRLSILTDYITTAFFRECYDPDYSDDYLEQSLSLVELELHENSSNLVRFHDDAFNTGTVYTAVAQGWLDHLSSLKIYKNNVGGTENMMEDQDISEWRLEIRALEEMEREMDREMDRISNGDYDAGEG